MNHKHGFLHSDWELLCFLEKEIAEIDETIGYNLDMLRWLDGSVPLYWGSDERNDPDENKETIVAIEDRLQEFFERKEDLNKKMFVIKSKVRKTVTERYNCLKEEE